MDLTSSHNFEDPSTTEEELEDDDDEGFISFGSSKVPKYTVKLDETIQEKCRTLIISEGLQATDFAKSHLPLICHEPIGKLVKEVQSDRSAVMNLGLRYKEPEPSWFFQINDETLLCTCSTTMSSEDFSLFATTMINSFRTTVAVVLLTVSATINFQSDEHPTVTETPLIRTLATLAYNSHGFVKDNRLEQPNILGGVAAGILTVCDIRQIPAVACIVFTSSLDAGVVEGFTAFLSSLESTRELQIASTGRFPVRTKCSQTGVFSDKKTLDFDFGDGMDSLLDGKIRWPIIKPFFSIQYFMFKNEGNVIHGQATINVRHLNCVTSYMAVDWINSHQIPISTLEQVEHDGANVTCCCFHLLSSRDVYETM